MEGDAIGKTQDAALHYTLGVAPVSSVQEIEGISVAAPQIRELDIGTIERNFQIPVSHSNSLQE